MDARTLAILVGLDDEAWDVGVTLPLTPYSIADGRWVAYFALPAPDVFVVLLRTHLRALGNELTC